METLHYLFEFCDNGVLVTDKDDGTKSVYQSKGGSEDYWEYTERAVKEGIGDMIAALMLDGSDKLPIKDKFNIKVEIR